MNGFSQDLSMKMNIVMKKKRGMPSYLFRLKSVYQLLNVLI